MDKVFSFFGSTMAVLATLILLSEFEQFKVTENKTCTEKELRIESKEQNIYFYCIEEIKVEDDRELYNFEEFVKNEGIEAVYKKENKRSIDRKNNTLIHHYNTFKIIECNNESKDIVIAKNETNIDSVC